MNAWFGISRWKATLVLVGAVILAVSIWFTNYLAKNLSEGERSKVALYVSAQEEISKRSEDLEADLTFYTDVILQADDIPVIVTDMNDEVSYGRAFGASEDTNAVYLARQLDKMIAQGVEPIINRFDGYKVYYTQSRLLTLLTYFPLFQLLLISAFIIVGFVGLSAAKRSQQNRVWVGMAKETAHQLGTPISAIIAWIEHLKETATDDQGEVIDELQRDVQRLEMIADRFSKIGSAPDLESRDIYSELARTKDYMSKRASRKIRFDFPESPDGPLNVRINPHLFNWVLENLLRNSLDAMDGEGKITASVAQDGKYVLLDISDTGKGIQHSKLKKVFEPGYTTKKRGWGLGLSLAKRIIENYHSGKIFVKRSRPGEGTTFTIKLPKN